MKSGSNGWFVVLALAVMATGCSAVGGRVWIPQSPGDVPQARDETVAKAPAPAPRRPAAPAAQAEQPPAVSPFRASASGASPAAQPAPRAAAAPASASAAPAPAAGSYTQATRYGDLLFVSGQIALDPRTNQFIGEKIEDQTRQVMENIRLILESHRLTMANVVSVTVYMKDLGQFRGMEDTYESFFRGTLPSRSVVEASRLPRGALVEISVIAGR